MSEELGELVKQYKTRSQGVFYLLAFIGGFFVIWIPILTVTDPTDMNRFFAVLFIGPPVTVGYAILLIAIYNLVKDPIKRKLRISLNQVLIEWKQKAIENTIETIESAAPVPIINIESYSHNILNQWLAQTYPSINLQKLNIVFPDTIFILQQLLAQKPFLGTYHQVEQQFVRTFGAKPNHLILSKKS